MDALIDTEDGSELLIDEEAPPEFGKIRLRQYQHEANEEVWRLFFTEGIQRLLGEAATGAGKTIMFADLARRMLEEGRGKTLILADQDELINQAVQKVQATTGLLAAVEKAERRAHPTDRIVVSTIQSMRSRLDRYAPDHFGLVVADEADRSIADQWMRVLGHFTCKELGVTATPERADRRDIMTFYQRKAFTVTLFDLIRMGYLSRISVRTVPISIDLSNVKQKRGDFDEKQLAETIEPYYAEVCEAVKEFAPTRKILSFHPLIASSMKFVEIALDHGLNFKHIDGKSADRHEIQRQFTDSQFQGLSNAQLLGRGWDEPSVDCVLNLRPTRHHSTYRQLIGRGTRIFCPLGCVEPCEHEERKKDLLILDPLWQFERFGVMTPANLIAKDGAQADAIRRKFQRSDRPRDLQEVDSEVAREKEEMLIKEFQRAKKRSGEYFDALEWAATMGQRELVDYEPETAFDAQPITEYQRKRLEKAGFVLETVRDFMHAEKIVKVLDKRIRSGLCTFKQAHWLRRFGVPDATEKTFAEASLLLNKCFERKTP